MSRSIVLILACIALLPPALWPQASTPEITAGELSAHIIYLASDDLEGRGSGMKGNQKAAAYIAGLLKEYGLEPMGTNGTYYQPFDFVAAVKPGGANALSFHGDPIPGGKKILTPDTDFRPFGFTSNATVTGPLVFAGYGISSSDSMYDDYKELDVKGKIVLALRYSPDGADPHGQLNLVSSFRNKARAARDKGALGLIIVTGPNDDADDDLITLSFDQASASSGIPVICVRRAAVGPLFTGMEWGLKSIQDSIKSRRIPVTFEFRGVTVSLTTDIIKVPATTSNIIGYLPGHDPTLKNQIIVLGAHMDHLGFGGPGSGSLKPDTMAIHHGADDNASGTAGLLELAQAYASKRLSLKRGLVFAFFSGEELGTLGSGFYVNNPPFPLANTTAMVNLDMIGRLENKILTVHGTGTSPAWNALLWKYNSDSTFTLKMVPDGFGPSDHAQFYGKNIPVLFFFTGTHNDYHKPSDTWDKINTPAEEKILRYVDNIVADLDVQETRPQFTKVQSSAPMGGADTRAFRVTLGVVPDYGAGESEGMKIGGLRPGGPAEKAGLQAGDIIISMAGKKIMNIYDYMGVLGELKAGEKVDVGVMRGGRPMTFSAEMQKRK